MAVSHASVGTPSDDVWIYNRKFDLVFLTLSGALVFLPYLSYGLLQRLGASTATASLIIGLAVTLLVGGPHMYSTYLRTALEPRFRARYGFLAYLPMLVIPVLVILGDVSGKGIQAATVTGWRHSTAGWRSGGSWGSGDRTQRRGLRTRWRKSFTWRTLRMIAYC